jgi:hypothetical protein
VKPTLGKLALVCVAGAVIARLTINSAEHDGVRPADVPDLIEYHVVGDGAEAAEVTYATASGGTAQEARVMLPWSYTLDDARSSPFLYISAQNLDHRGCVTAQIAINSKVAKETRSCGEFVIASTSGRFP